MKKTIFFLLIIFIFFFFFFKQKTAYEIYQCDWSSDVCSSDLWSRAMLGEDYPFFIKNEKQIFAYILKFEENYDVLYAKFTEWFNNWFIPVYADRCANDGLYVNLIKYIYESYTPEQIGQLENMKSNSIISLVLEHGGDSFIFYEVIKKLHDLGLVEKAFVNTGLKLRESGSIIFIVPWNEHRLVLKEFFGFVDAGVELGNLKKV